MWAIDVSDGGSEGPAIQRDINTTAREAIVAHERETNRLELEID